MNRLVAVLLGAALAAAAFGARLDEMVLRDSPRAVRPRQRAAWLRDRGLPEPARPSADSQGLGVVGRWSYGPAYDVDCWMTPAETLIALGRGSGVSLLRFSRSDTAEFRLLSDINSAGLIGRVRLADTLLLVGTGAGVETYSISDERSPNLLSTLLTPLNDFAMRESLLYVMGYDDSFKTYSIADPVNPRRLGAYQDSGGPVALTGNTALVGDQSGLHAIDVSNPANPHRVGSWGSSVISAEARGNICCVTEYDPDSVLLFLLDVSNPASMHQLSTLRGAGGDALCIDGQYVYTAGGYGFQILDISDSLNPLIVGRHGLGDYKYGVWCRAGLDRALVANEVDGLAVMNTSDPSHPEPDTNLLAAGMTVDVDVKGPLAYLANDMGGLKVLDVSNPAQPTMIGERDTVYANEWSYSVAVDDSFAFMGWFNTPFFRTVDVSNPTRPAFAGSCDPFEFAQDMVLRDSFVYCAESYKFQVVNVARPLAPAVVGTCGLPDYTFDLYLWDTLAYVANSYNLNILDITQPANPQLVGTLNGYPNAMDRRDTFMFVVSDFWLVSYSVADPVQPRALDSVSLTGHMHDVLVLDSIAYCGGWVMQMVDVADPQNMRVLPETWVPPSWIRRIVYAPPYLYTCCTEGGVCIMETLQTGIAEPGRAEGEQAQKGASVVSGVLFLPEASGHEPQAASWLLDISGRKVLDLHPGANDVRALAPGVYFVRQALGVKRGAPDVTKVIIAQ